MSARPRNSLVSFLVSYVTRITSRRVRRTLFELCLAALSDLSRLSNRAELSTMYYLSFSRASDVPNRNPIQSPTRQLSGSGRRWTRATDRSIPIPPIERTDLTRSKAIFNRPPSRWRLIRPAVSIGFSIRFSFSRPIAPGPALPPVDPLIGSDSEC